jgi:hypothetical protein
MAIPAEFASKFPLATLVLIFSAGLLFTAFFPFDVMGFDFGDEGLPLPALENLHDYGTNLESNYKPCINLKQLSDFPNGLIKLLLVSIIPGVGLFLMQDCLVWLHKVVMRGKVKEFLKGKNKYTEFPVKGDTEGKRIINNTKFTKWLKENDYYNFADVTNSLKYVSSGFLYAFESLALLTGILFLIVSALRFEISTKLLWWGLIFLAFGFGAYLFFIISESYVNKKFAGLYDAFEKTPHSRSLTEWVK